MNRDEFSSAVRKLIFYDRHIDDMSDILDCDIGDSFIGDLESDYADLLLKTAANHPLNYEDYNKFWDMISKPKVTDREIFEFYDMLQKV